MLFNVCCFPRTKQLFTEAYDQLAEREILRPASKALTWLAGNGSVMYGIVKMWTPEYNSAIESFSFFNSEGYNTFNAGALTFITAIVLIDLGLVLSTEVAHQTGEIAHYFVKDLCQLDKTCISLAKCAGKAVTAVKAKFCPRAQPAQVEGAPVRVPV